MTNSSSTSASVSPGRRSFASVAEDWLALVAPTISTTTLAEYRRALDRYFLPTYGRKPIASIQYEEFALFVARLPPMAGKTFNNIMIPARGVFEYAFRTRKVKQDITTHILWRKHQAPGPDPLEVDEVMTVLDHLAAAYHPVWRNYFEVAFFTGLRPSEMIATRWPSVDFRREQLRVSAARVRATDKDTKTHAIRHVDLQTLALCALRRQRELTESKTGLVFLNPSTGRKFADTAAPLQVWYDALKAAGIRKRGARQTRHTYATLCLHAGMNPAYVSRQMGHANAKMFFEVYSRWIDGDANTREKAKMDTFLTVSSTTPFPT
ncbi:tyrosine-type recombinase/integrase [Castellaniella denitrificans]|uniref:tyrosine-type recombinase/integrase n=1 Tax=Castellaniella denitrificans TaxID=56119 RepID=UPI0038B2A3D4